MTGLTNGIGYTFTVTATNCGRHRPGLDASATGHPVHRARGTDRRDRHVQRQRPVGGVVDRSGHQRRGDHHRLHGDLVAGRLHLHHHRDHHLHGDRADQRHRLHLHGDRHQRRRHRAGLDGLAHGDAVHAPRCTDRGDRHVQRQRPVGGVVDGTGQQRRHRRHQLHGDLVAGRLHLHHRHHQLHRAPD